MAKAKFKPRKVGIAAVERYYYDGERGPKDAPGLNSILTEQEIRKLLATGKVNMGATQKWRFKVTVEQLNDYRGNR